MLSKNLIIFFVNEIFESVSILKYILSRVFYFLTDSSPHDYQSSLTSVYTASPVDESTV